MHMQQFSSYVTARKKMRKTICYAHNYLPSDFITVPEKSKPCYHLFYLFFKKEKYITAICQNKTLSFLYVVTFSIL